METTITMSPGDPTRGQSAGPSFAGTVQDDWNVWTTRWWMNLLAPIAGGVFRTNHDFVMSDGLDGLDGLTRLLGVKAISIRAT